MEKKQPVIPSDMSDGSPVVIYSPQSSQPPQSCQSQIDELFAQLSVNNDRATKNGDGNQSTGDIPVVSRHSKFCKTQYIDAKSFYLKTCVIKKVQDRLAALGEESDESINSILSGFITQKYSSVTNYVRLSDISRPLKEFFTAVVLFHQIAPQLGGLVLFPSNMETISLRAIGITGECSIEQEVNVKSGVLLVKEKVGDTIFRNRMTTEEAVIKLKSNEKYDGNRFRVLGPNVGVRDEDDLNTATPLLSIATEIITPDGKVFFGVTREYDEEGNPIFKMFLVNSTFSDDCHSFAIGATNYTVYKPTSEGCDIFDLNTPYPVKTPYNMNDPRAKHIANNIKFSRSIFPLITTVQFLNPTEANMDFPQGLFIGKKKLKCPVFCSTQNNHNNQPTVIILHDGLVYSVPREIYLSHKASTPIYFKLETRYLQDGRINRVIEVDDSNRHKIDEKIASMKLKAASRNPVSAVAPLETDVVAPSEADVEAKNALGEQLFPLINASHSLLASKITGMLLEMDNSEIQDLIDSPEALAGKVDEALYVLRQHGIN